MWIMTPTEVEKAVAVGSTLRCSRCNKDLIDCKEPIVRVFDLTVCLECLKVIEADKDDIERLTGHEQKGWVRKAYVGGLRDAIRSRDWEEPPDKEDAVDVEDALSVLEAQNAPDAYKRGTGWRACIEHAAKHAAVMAEAAERELAAAKDVLKVATKAAKEAAELAEDAAADNREMRKRQREK